MDIKNCNYLITNALPFQGEYMQLNMNPGVPLRSAPGYVLVAPAGRVLPGHVHPRQVHSGRVLPRRVLPRRIHPMSGLLCSLILLANLYRKDRIKSTVIPC